MYLYFIRINTFIRFVSHFTILPTVITLCIFIRFHSKNIHTDVFIFLSPQMRKLKENDGLTCDIIASPGKSLDSQPGPKSYWASWSLQVTVAQSE